LRDDVDHFAIQRNRHRLGRIYHSLNILLIDQIRMRQLTTVAAHAMT
jgi:hypothetical protein